VRDARDDEAWLRDTVAALTPLEFELAVDEFGFVVQSRAGLHNTARSFRVARFEPGERSAAWVAGVLRSHGWERRGMFDSVMMLVQSWDAANPKRGA